MPLCTALVAAVSAVGGKPVLTDVNTGRFNGAHSPKLFVELYAPQQKFYVWKQKPPERLTVWQFWQRLQEAGQAFWPGRGDCRGRKIRAQHVIHTQLHRCPSVLCQQVTNAAVLLTILQLPLCMNPDGMPACCLLLRRCFPHDLPAWTVWSVHRHC